MGLTEQRASAWKFLKSQVAKVQDPDLRMAMMAEFRKRALNEWGFNPDNGKLATTDNVILSDWEREFVADIQKTIQFELDVRKEKRESERHEMIADMRKFVQDGGRLMDIPDDIRTPDITAMYFDAVRWYGDQLMEAYDAVSDR